MSEGRTATKEIKGKDMSAPRNDVEEYYAYVGEHSQRQTHLGESREVMTVNHVKDG